MHATSVEVKDNLDKLAIPDSRTLLVARFVKEYGYKTLNQMTHILFLSRISYLAKITELYSMGSL